MDRGPVRVSRPAAQRPEARRQEEVAQLEPVSSEPKHAAVHRSVSHSQKEPAAKSKLPAILISIVAAILLLVGGWFGWTALQGGAPAIDANKYQAVFFTNGQVYFGKLTSLNGGYLKLTDVFYLQSQGEAKADAAADSKNPQEEGAADSGNLQLIKLGKEVHGPEDALILSRDQVLFYENLKSDSKVVQAIEQQKTQ